MFCFLCSWLICTFENPIGLGSGRALSRIYGLSVTSHLELVCALKYILCGFRGFYYFRFVMWEGETKRQDSRERIRQKIGIPVPI